MGLNCDLHRNVKGGSISMTTAALGGAFEVTTLDGSQTRVKVPEGTQNGRQFRLKGKGMPVLRQPNIGDLYIQTAVETPQTAELERGSETILVVEDEPQVRAIAVNMLRARGYCVLVAASGEEALQLARAQKSVDLVVSDVVMPQESGPDLVARLRSEHKSLPALFVSGYAPDVLTDAVAPGAAFLQKPYTGRQLALRVRQILDGHSSATAGWPPAGPATSAGSLPS